MAKILIADLQKGALRLTTILSDHYELVYTNTVEQAMRLLRAPDEFDLVIVGVLFDDSRMYDLIQQIRRSDQLKSLPVMGFSDEHTAISVAGRDAIESGSHLLGVADYVDTSSLNDKEILQRIETVLAEKKGIGRVKTEQEPTPGARRRQQESDRTS